LARPLIASHRQNHSKCHDSPFSGWPSRWTAEVLGQGEEPHAFGDVARALMKHSMRFHSNFFTRDPKEAPMVIRGAGIVFVKRPDEYVLKSGEKYRPNLTRAEVMNKEVWPTGEIMIDAASHDAALPAFNLFLASLVVLEGGDAFFLPQPFEVERLRQEGSKEQREFSTIREGLMRACVLAARASRRRSVGYAVHKLRLSYSLAAPPIVDLDPSMGGPKLFMVGRDPMEHVYGANAVALAYSVIEELGFEVRVQQNEASKMPDGTWNARVRADLETRLSAGGIDLNQTHVWSLRGPPTRIELAKRPPTAVRKPPWSQGPVRDIELSLIDAIAMASWLRSKVSTHRFSDNVRSLTPYDIHNAQSLARHLLLKRCRLWRKSY
jgi:hypothetical protein